LFYREDCAELRSTGGGIGPPFSPPKFKEVNIMDVFEAAEMYLARRDDWATRAAQIVLGIAGGVMMGAGAVLWFLQ